MDALELIARFVLAAVFAVAGLTKLADRPGSREALVAFGVPEGLASPGAIALPLAELAVAGLLIPAATAAIGAVGALALLLAFCAGIARSMMRGESPDCHCFGQLRSEPVGWSTLIRNLVLAALAGFALAETAGGGAEAPFAWIGDLSDAGLVALIGGIVLAGLAAAGAGIASALLRQNGRLLLRVDALEQALRRQGIPLEAVADAPAPEGLAVGTAAPAFTVGGVHGDTTTLAALLSPGRPLMLIFTDPGCGPCNALMPQVAQWQREHEGALTIALVGRGDVEDNRAKVAEHGVRQFFVEEGSEVSSLYQAQATPTAVVIDAEGRIASPLHGGEPGIRALLETTLAQRGLQVVQAAPSAPSGLGLGDPPPEVALTDLDGDPAAIAERVDEDTMLLFWNPTCGFCARMLEDLRAFEREPPEGAPGLLLISTGTPESNRAMDLEAPILLDGAFAAANAYGAPGTPSAVLIDADAKVASQVAVGADAVFELAGRTVEA
jgi:thiol-disulfide isomerase/thioredoxin